jgi:catechol-2,3-dioxygenase
LSISGCRGVYKHTVVETLYMHDPKRNGVHISWREIRRWIGALTVELLIK